MTKAIGFILIAAFLGACGNGNANAPKKVEDGCLAETNCVLGSGASTWQSCSNGVSTWYLTGDQAKLECATLSDCTAAAQQLTEWCKAN
jgi:hypothetical protein